MGFSRKEYWSGLPFPPPGDLRDPGVKPTSPTSPALAGRFFAPSTTWEVSGSPKGTSGLLCHLKVHQLCAFPSWLSFGLLYTLCLAPSFNLNNGSLALKVGKPLSYLQHLGMVIKLSFNTSSGVEFNT